MSNLPPGYEPELPPGYEPEHSASPADAGPTPEEAKTISGLTALRAQNPQEDARTLLGRLKAGERGYQDMTGGRPARASDAELLQAVRGTLPINGAESFSRGALQGASLGYADEAAGGLGALVDKMKGSTGTLGDLYRKNRDESRAAYGAAKDANPGLYGFGDAAGNLATLAVPGLGAGKGILGAVKAGTALGAATGLGNSTADLTRGEFGRAAFDTGVGGGVGGVLGLAGGGVEKIGDALAARFGGKLAAAGQKAAELGTETGTAPTRAGFSQAGRESSALQRLLEHIEGKRAVGSPEALAELEQLEREGLIDEANRHVFGNAVGGLREQLAAAKASREAAHQLLAEQPERIAQATAEASKPTWGADLASLSKSYAEPVVASALGGVVGGPAGATAAGLIFGRTRAGGAIARRFAKPGNQMALYSGLQSLVRGGEAVGEGGLASAARSEATQTAASENFLSAFPQLKAAMNGNGTQQPNEALGANP